MPRSMASWNLLALLFLLPLPSTLRTVASDDSIQLNPMYHYPCSERILACSSVLYQNNGLRKEQIASYYSVNTSEIKSISHANKQDYLVTVPCSCQNVNGTTGYFYKTQYDVQPNDAFVNVSSQIYSGQAWRIGDEEKTYVRNSTVPVHLLCGCPERDSQIVVTYTVQQHDTISDIGILLSAQISEIEKLNKILTRNPAYIDVNWVLYVPSEKNGIPAAKKNITGFESERPVVYSLEEIAEATINFDESRKIGEGGYGSVYFGVLGEQEVAVKKMRSNKSKEFLAELKVLCKVHHINVVELMGYASGDDHLYLVYEYISNGSLGEHLHDPLLKGHQPLSWTARIQIALDTAKGIEYIHDHTKSRYVHRDIKTTNILLDEGLRAKVADFGLAKLVGRTNEDDFIATRLVGTPGYLPPESVKELQVTTKTDVFAFGVVLAELITGQRALIREKREPNKMKSLITVVHKVFQAEEPEAELASVIDGNLEGSYPMEEVYKMAEIADWCLSEDAVNRPEMREIVVALSQIMMSSTEWEASLGGRSQVFSGVFNGR
ncbi:hypothetical protein RJ640_016092 [Escallonia rubra]|uniref:LysM domain receptor-like kinase 3 n=1 Tax=Escallonia rubra TaxID=112253 RepID=A0AA88QUV1_9ASTE|nr:hypothetical protein RJ640_016092 [Escallonia rubra]